MQLTKRQIDHLERKFYKIPNIVSILENGSFYIFDVSEDQLNTITNFLSSEKSVQGFSIFKLKNNYKILGVFDSIFLSESIEKHKKLNPKFWDSDNELKPEIKNQIKKIVKFFKKQLEEKNFEIKILDIQLVGSNANYNYTKDSDLDIHIIADPSLDCNKKHLRQIYDLFRSSFKNNFDISLKNVNVELFVELDGKSSAKSNGRYSLNFGWIQNPSLIDIPDYDIEDFQKEYQKWENKVNQLLKKKNLENIENFLDDIYDLRQKSIQKDGEFAQENLIFKELRNSGLLDELKDLKNELIEKQLSI